MPSGAHLVGAICDRHECTRTRQSPDERKAQGLTFCVRRESGDQQQSRHIKAVDNSGRWVMGSWSRAGCREAQQKSGKMRGYWERSRAGCDMLEAHFEGVEERWVVVMSRCRGLRKRLCPYWDDLHRPGIAEFAEINLRGR